MPWFGTDSLQLLVQWLGIWLSLVFFHFSPCRSTLVVPLPWLDSRGTLEAVVEVGHIQLPGASKPGLQTLEAGLSARRA